MGYQYSEIRHGKTPGRCFMNKTLVDLEFEHPVLDVGGGHDWSYHRHMDTNHEKTITMNLPRAESMDIIADAESKFPFSDGSFSTVFCFNVIEHIYDFQNVFRESYRVLKDDGKLLLWIPFLHKIHGDPSDFNRFTEYRLRQDLSSFSNVNVYPLDEGPISAGFYQIQPILKFNLLKYIGWEVSRRMDSALKRSVSKYDELFTGRFPIGYAVEAQK